MRWTRFVSEPFTESRIEGLLRADYPVNLTCAAVCTESRLMHLQLSPTKQTSQNEQL